MTRADMRDYCAQLNCRAEQTRHRAEPIAWGAALAVMLGIAGAVLCMHWACGA